MRRRTNNEEEEEGDAELFLRRCCESPTIAASRMLESFLTEGVFYGDGCKYCHDY